MTMTTASRMNQPRRRRRRRNAAADDKACGIERSDQKTPRRYRKSRERPASPRLERALRSRLPLPSDSYSAGPHAGPSPGPPTTSTRHLRLYDPCIDTGVAPQLPGRGPNRAARAVGCPVTHPCYVCPGLVVEISASDSFLRVFSRGVGPFTRRCARGVVGQVAVAACFFGRARARARQVRALGDVVRQVPVPASPLLSLPASPDFVPSGVNLRPTIGGGCGLHVPAEQAIECSRRGTRHPMDCHGPSVRLDRDSTINRNNGGSQQWFLVNVYRRRRVESKRRAAEVDEHSGDQSLAPREFGGRQRWRTTRVRKQRCTRVRRDERRLRWRGAQGVRMSLPS
jgi:hypothetical protein